MEGSHFDRLSDDLVVTIFWPPKRLFPRPHGDDTLWASVQPSAQTSPCEPCYQMSHTVFPAASLPAAFADADYNLLLASTCSRWRRLAKSHVATLLVKQNRAVSLEIMTAAVKCFPELTHLHLSDRSVNDMDYAFLDGLAACCPKLTAFHLGKGIVEEYMMRRHYYWEARLDVFFRRDSLFSFADLPSLKSLDMESADVSLDLLFPPQSQYSLLERLTICNCNVLENLPDDIGNRLPCLRELTISNCRSFSERPQQVSSFTCLRKLTLSSCAFHGLPGSFGVMPNLKTLVLHHLDLGISFPDSCTQLISLESLIVSECESLVNLPDPLGALTALKTLCIAGSPLVTLPDDMGELPTLETVFLKQYRASHLLPPSFTALTSLIRLELHECGLDQLPEAMGGLGRLRELYVVGCSQIEALPESVSALVRRENLVLDKCSSLLSVPVDLSNLTRLKQLELTGCEKLSTAPTFLPRSLEILSVGCSGKFIKLPHPNTHPSLKGASMNSVIIPSSLSYSLSSLEHLHLILAFPMKFPFPLTALPCLRTLTIESTYVMELPDFSTSTLQELRRLELRLLEQTEIPATIAALRKLTDLEIDAPRLRSLPASIGALSRLCKLSLLNCPALTHVPGSLTQLSFLRKLRVHRSCIISARNHFERISRLQILDS
ncbi:unnamed protein product [Closterium sp. NIES-53]